MRRIEISLALFFTMMQSIFSQQQVVVKTPCCNYDDRYPYEVNNEEWTTEEVENCYQSWLYTGGFYIQNVICQFDKKSNYLANHEILCFDFDGNFIYGGTNNGLVVSSDYGERWDWEGENIDFLEGYTIHAISINDNQSGRFIACTNAGVHVSTNDGNSWIQSYSSTTFTCIALGNNQDIYVGASSATISGEKGVYKSTDFGSSWNITSLNGTGKETNALYFDGNYIYAGTNTGLYKSTNNGTDWSLISSGEWNITVVYKHQSNLIVGVLNNGCYLSTNEGGNWTAKNDGFPTNQRVNTMISYTISPTFKYLYAGTDGSSEKSLMRARLLDNDIGSWYVCNVKDDEDVVFKNMECELKVKMLCVNNNDGKNDLWVACYGGALYPSADKNITNPFGAETLLVDWNCHAYAWHYSEGGESRLDGIDEPDYPKHPYINLSETKNWDYIQEQNWKSEFWEKVTYGNLSHYDPYVRFLHAGIKSPNDNNPMPENEDDLVIISKWGQIGPLIKHNLLDNPWGGSIIGGISITHSYWKCKKEISGDPDNENKIKMDHFIGRQIITSGPSVIDAPSDVAHDNATEPPNGYIDFKVAQMNDHKIHLTNGFKVPSGKSFHAFVSTDCGIPWEEYPTQEKRAELNNIKDEPRNILKNHNKSDENLVIDVYPNPSNQEISILAKLNNLDGPIPINIIFYSFDGKIIKIVIIKNGIEEHLKVDDFHSGAYLITASADILIETGDKLIFSDNNIIIIKR